MYTIPRPRFPVAAWLYAAAVLIGLIGLFFVAVETFHLFHDWPVAVMFGLVIEFGAVVESIALARGLNWRNWWIIPGLIVTLTVSGGYNYLAAQRGGALLDPPVTSPWLLAAVGVGPLSAVFFIAAQLGNLVREHEEAAAKWEASRQKWLDDRSIKVEQIKRQAEDEERAERMRMEEAAREERMRIEQMRIQKEKDVQLAQLAQEERAQARAERRAARADRAERAQEVHKGNAPALRRTYGEFAAAQRARNGSGPMNYQQVMSTFGVARRTAYDWLEKYEREKAPHAG